MKLLPNGCSRSEIKVTPKNWKTSPQSITRKWRIAYRFYDQQKNVKQVTIKGMNHLNDWNQRKIFTEDTIRDEIKAIDVEGYNPITGRHELPETENTFCIQPSTGFVKSITLAKDFLEGTYETKANIKSVIKYVSKAATQLSLHTTPISDIKRKQVLIILDKCREIKKSFSNRNYNLYRAVLMALFKVMVKYEVIEYNPVDEYLEKKPEQIKIRPTLSPAQRIKLSTGLKEKNYSYWLFVNIFFHSGCRLRELFRLKVSDVDLLNQRYKAIIKKGNRSRELWRPIKNIALPFWQELLLNAEANHFVFGKGFKPGEKQHYNDRATKLWNQYVKEEMEIPVDLYSLKHLNLDEVAAELSIKEAQKLAEHTTPIITMKHYTQGESERQMNRIKEVNNSLG